MINELRIKYPFRDEQVVGSNPTSGSIKPKSLLRGDFSFPILRHVSPRFVSRKKTKSTQVILAQRWIGRRAVDDDIIARLRRNPSPYDRAALIADAACAPAWIAEIFRILAKDPVPSQA